MVRATVRTVNQAGGMHAAFIAAEYTSSSERHARHVASHFAVLYNLANVLPLKLLHERKVQGAQDHNRHLCLM